MSKDKLFILLIIAVVVLLCAWIGEWDRPTMVWASEVCVHR